ncbi:hypothetical protein [Enterococcus sp. AZ109]|uniref:hypothetical protein n=1 Tax=Enterococcus sp. AZ109 TaxID=2774634 RepID=UPI003F23123A
MISTMPNPKYIRLEQRVLSRTLSEIVFAHEDYNHRIGTEKNCSFCKRYRHLRKQLIRNTERLTQLRKENEK